MTNLLFEPVTPRLSSSDLVTRSSQIRAETVDKQTRSVNCVIATEQPVIVRDSRSFALIHEVLRMDGVQFAGRVPLLHNHMRSSLDDILGSVRQMNVQGQQLFGQLSFVDQDKIAERAWKKVRDGHVTDVSVGYRSIEATDIPKGQTRVIKGLYYTAGELTLRISTSWEVREVSLVPIGADPEAKIREAVPESQHTAHTYCFHLLIDGRQIGIAVSGETQFAAEANLTRSIGHSCFTIERVTIEHW